MENKLPITRLNKFFSEEDFDLFTIVDTPEEAMEYILENIHKDEQEDINFIKGILESRLVELKLDRLSVEKILRSIGKAK